MATSLPEAVRFKMRLAELTSDGTLPYLGRLLQRAARLMPQRSALITDARSFSYAALYYYATELSRKLLAHRVQPRNRVLLLFENEPAFYVGYFGILHVGAVVVPLNTFLQERELAHIFADAQPAAVVVSSALAHLVEQLARASNIPVVTESQMQLEAPVPPVLTNFQVQDLPVEEMVTLLYTSGTTGVPKGVMLSSKNIVTNLLQGIARFEISADDRIFAVLPLFHSFAQNTCVWAPMLIGCTVVLVPKIDRRAIVNALAHKPTIMLGVPSLYALFCLMKHAPLGTVRIFVSGGDALPDRIRAAFALIYRRKICNGYGLTEASPLVAGDIDDEFTVAATIGRPLYGITVSIRDEQGNPQAKGSIGQLWIQGDNVMLGYYKAPELTNQVLNNGWLSTGDLAYLDPKGRIVIAGRYKDLIIHKGFNVYPQEIENVILLHPNVLRVGVIGVPDTEHGETVVAYVQLKEELPAFESELRAWCNKNLALYKVPRTFICSIEVLPITATGKVDKKVLRQQYA